MKITISDGTGLEIHPYASTAFDAYMGVVCGVILGSAILGPAPQWVFMLLILGFGIVGVIIYATGESVPPALQVHLQGNALDSVYETARTLKISEDRAIHASLALFSQIAQPLKDGAKLTLVNGEVESELHVMRELNERE